MSTEPRLVIVTGGGRGIGGHITTAFHALGDRVCILSRSDSGLAGQLGPRVRHIRCDSRSRADVFRAVDAAVGWGGRLDVVVNNVGRSAWRPLERIDELFWSDMLAVNLSSVFYTCQAAQRHLTQGGSIVSVSSLAGKRGSANNTAYCAAKFGVNGVTQALAKELGPSGIRVNAVCPVYVETEGLGNALVDPAAPPAGKPVDEYLAEFARTQTALGRLPSAREVAQACLLLASPHASAITGQCINVDCGVLPQ